jgi:hypothetical protein
MRHLRLDERVFVKGAALVAQMEQKPNLVAHARA